MQLGRYLIIGPAVIQSYEGMDVAEEVDGKLVIPPEDKALLVKYYEMLYKEDAKKMNKFLDPIIQAGYDEDVMNIKFLSYKADEPYRTLLFYAIPEITIIDYNEPDAMCLFGMMQVDLGPGGADGMNDLRGAYYVFFHEIGHGVDDAIQKYGWFAPYRVTELKYVESTDEEYQAFITSYFETLQKDAEYLRQDEKVIDVYKVKNYNAKSSWIDFSFCQTSKSKKLPLKYTKVGSEEGYTIEKKWEAHGIYNLDIFYSKSGKYLMYFEGNYEFETYEEWLHIIKTFCELED